MNVNVLSVHELSDRHIAAWRTLQAANPNLQSPYFCPEFAQLTAIARSGDRGEVCIAAIQTDGASADASIVGFFPFWRSPAKLSRTKHIAHPIAGSLTDFQGLIVADQEVCDRLDPQDLLRQCNLSQWYFDHLLTSQTRFQPYHSKIEPSPTIDVTAGYDAYLESRQQVSRSQFKRIARLSRKVTREIGPLRYESHVEDPALLETLLNWKSQQFIRTGLDDLFAIPWTRSLVGSIHATQTEGFAGMLSALYAGDQLLAAHMGMRSEHVWHYWLPSYNHEFKQFKPGFLLLLSMIEDAATRGMHTLDLGKGDDSYKPLFSNCETQVATGCAAIPSLAWTLTQTAQQTTQTLRKFVHHTKQLAKGGRPRAL